MKTFGYIVIAVLVSFVLAMNVFRVFPLNETSMFITVVGLIYGLMAAFTINNVWERFSKIRDAIAEEVSSLLHIQFMLTSFADKKTVKAFSDQLVKYCNLILVTDWKVYWVAQNVHNNFFELYKILGGIKTKDDKESALYSACLAEMNQSSTARTHQLVLAQSKLSTLQWGLIGVLSLILTISVVFLALPKGLLSFFITAATAFSIALILLVIYEFNALEIDKQEISNEPYRDLIRKLGREREIKA